MRVALRPLFKLINGGRAPCAAEDYLRHVPESLQYISDVQYLEQSAANAATSGHGSHHIEIRLRGKRPEEDDRDDKHLAARHERGRADGEVEHRNRLCAVEDAVGGEADEDGGLWKLMLATTTQRRVAVGNRRMICIDLGEGRGVLLRIFSACGCRGVECFRRSVAAVWRTFFQRL